jgi:hypothetical protein
VRRDADVAAAIEERLERADVARTNLVEVPVRDLGRLDVDPLAEANVRAGERARILFRAMEGRLQHDAEVVEPLRA